MNKINIYYSRHSNTYRNILKELKFLNKLYFKKMDVENAALSNYGINHALHIYNHFNFNNEFNPEIVCASYYVRTWISAFILYNDYFTNNNPLYILPYIHEYHSNVKPSSLDKMNEIKYFNIQNSIKIFKNYILYLKKFMKVYYKKLYDTFTFKIPKIVFINKKGNIIKEKNINNINYYIKNVYIYNPNLKIFENKILKKLLNIVNKDIKNIGIITHGKLIKKDLLYISYSNNNSLKISKKYVSTSRKFDNNYIEVNNCDTYLKKYTIYKDNINHDKKCKQLFPIKNKLNYFDEYIVPYYNKKFKNKKIVLQILKSHNYKLKENDIKYIFGFYYKTYKNNMNYFKKLIKLYNLFLIKNNKNNKNNF